MQRHEISTITAGEQIETETKMGGSRAQVVRTESHHCIIEKSAPAPENVSYDGVRGLCATRNKRTTDHTKHLSSSIPRPPPPASCVAPAAVLWCWLPTSAACSGSYSCRPGLAARPKACLGPALASQPDAKAAARRPDRWVAERLGATMPRIRKPPSLSFQGNILTSRIIRPMVMTKLPEVSDCFSFPEIYVSGPILYTTPSRRISRHVNHPPPPLFPSYSL